MPGRRITPWISRPDRAERALELSRAIRERELSCREVMQRLLARIHRLNPVFNARQPRPDEVLLREADAADAELARGHWRGWMHGCRRRSRTPAGRRLPHHLRLASC